MTRAVPVLSWYVEPDGVVLSGTDPAYWPVPVPVRTAWKSNRALPEVASVMTWSSLGVPSSWVPPTTDSQASTGSTPAAQTTSRGAPSTAGRVASAFFATASALWAAVEEVTRAVVVATLRPALLASDTVERPFLTCTTRSPPRTGRPA